jgi:hypothetical protein
MEAELIIDDEVVDKVTKTARLMINGFQDE